MCQSNLTSQKMYILLSSVSRHHLSRRLTQCRNTNYQLPNTFRVLYELYNDCYRLLGPLVQSLHYIRGVISYLKISFRCCIHFLDENDITRQQYYFTPIVARLLADKGVERTNISWICNGNEWNFWVCL